MAHNGLGIKGGKQDPEGSIGRKSQLMLCKIPDWWTLELWPHEYVLSSGVSGDSGPGPAYAGPGQA